MLYAHDEDCPCAECCPPEVPATASGYTYTVEDLRAARRQSDADHRYNEAGELEEFDNGPYEDEPLHPASGKLLSSAPVLRPFQELRRLECPTCRRYFCTVRCSKDVFIVPICEGCQREGR